MNKYRVTFYLIDKSVSASATATPTADGDTWVKAVTTISARSIRHAERLFANYGISRIEVERLD